ncbi:hypothetical protein Ancab_016233 [Ancistrocladus abbreviatus]
MTTKGQQDKMLRRNVGGDALFKSPRSARSISEDRGIGTYQQSNDESLKSVQKGNDKKARYNGSPSLLLNEELTINEAFNAIDLVADKGKEQDYQLHLDRKAREPFSRANGPISKSLACVMDGCGGAEKAPHISLVPKGNRPAYVTHASSGGLCCRSELNSGTISKKKSMRVKCWAFENKKRVERPRSPRVRTGKHLPQGQRR